MTRAAIGGAVVGVVIAFIAALFQYIGGRIILPEMGLHAPHYWAWFWFVILGEIPGAFIIGYIVEALK